MNFFKEGGGEEQGGAARSSEAWSDGEAEEGRGARATNTAVEGNPWGRGGCALGKHNQQALRH